MGRKRARFATPQCEAIMNNIIKLDDEDEVLTELEKGKIAVG